MQAATLSRRQGEDFFSRGLDVREYRPEASLTVGALMVSLVPTRHYVPGWGVAVAGAGGRPRVVVSGDTGPNHELVEAARSADLLVVEATLEHADDDVVPRGHLSADEAFETGSQAGAARVLLTHLPTERRATLRAVYRRSRPRVSIARPGLRIVLPTER